MTWIATAVIGGAVIGGIASNSAASKAAKAQTAAAQAGADVQMSQFDALKELLSPYVQAGNGSLTAQQNLIGLSGAGAQQTAIDAIQNGAEFKALNAQGQNAILANASATGGLRGGNVQAALSQFSPNLLASLINQQYTRLGGITSLGQNAAAMQGNAGMQSANSISQLLQQQGAAQAGSALATGQAWNNAASSVGSGLMLANMLGGSSTTGGGGGGGAPTGGSGIKF